MSDLDLLIARLRERVHGSQGSSDNASDYAAHLRKPPAPPLYRAAMAEAESALGFALPTLLYRLYSEVGNGEWGPGYGLEPLYQTASQRAETVREVVTVVTRAKYFQAHEPKLVPLLQIADWGCAISSWVDTAHPELPVVRSDPNLEDEILDQVTRRMTGQKPMTNPYRFFNAWRECDSLREWLQAWVDGADLWNLGYPPEWQDAE